MTTPPEPSVPPAPASASSTSGAPRSAGGDIDPRGPRFGASITAVLLLVVIALALSGLVTAAALLLAALTALFAWGAFAGIRRHPYGTLYARLVRPRLAPPAELEDPTPPSFAQGVGLAVTGVGLVLFLLGVGAALPVSAALAFVAAFLNAVFGLCLGCQAYLLLARTGVIRRKSPALR
jgi:Flp pilus assembly protein TadB